MLANLKWSSCVSISSIPGGGIPSWPSSGSYTRSAPADSSQAEGSPAHGLTPAALTLTDRSYDEVSVSLPNGMTVGVINLGGTGFDSAALKTFEDFVQKLASQNLQAQPASGADGTGASSDADAQSNRVGLDKLHVDLPNGISFEVRHSSGGQPADSAAVMKELTDAAEELAEVFGHYAPASTAASAYASSQAMLSGPANQVDTQT
jgi:hypothetical protein